MATFIAQQWQGSSQIITVKPLQQGPVANEHKEIEHQAETESGDEALLMASGQTEGWLLWRWTVNRQLDDNCKRFSALWLLALCERWLSSFGWAGHDRMAVIKLKFMCCCLQADGCDSIFCDHIKWPISCKSTVLVLNINSSYSSLNHKKVNQTSHSNSDGV